MIEDRTVVAMRGITKSFGSVLANDQVNFDLAAGEIQALLGENGAGKTTLMNILSGLYQPDTGNIEVEGKKTRIPSPREALNLGIGMVHQHFMLIEGHTVAENIILGLPEPRFYLSTGSINRRINELAEKYQMEVDPEARIWELSIGERQRVEILKLLYRETRILILDEPTAVLTPEEVEHLFETLRKIRGSGGSIVFISHKLEEVMAISDRVTVLRGGRKISTLSSKETSAVDLAVMMVGEAALPRGRKYSAAFPGSKEAILTLEGVRTEDDRGLTAIDNLDLEVMAGEIFGLLGVAGNGQKELVEVITGLRKPSSGRIILKGRELTGAGPRRYLEAGVAHIPEDRLGVGAVGAMTMADNLLLKNYRLKPYSQGLFLNRTSMDDQAAALIRRFGVVPENPDLPAGTLSGGNLQRLILSRELSTAPSLLVAAYPFRGLDLKAVDFLGRTLREEAAGGLAVFLVGEDLELTLELSDRVGVIYEGRILKVMPVADVRLDELGLMMAGKLSRGEGN